MGNGESKSRKRQDKDPKETAPDSDEDNKRTNLATEPSAKTFGGANARDKMYNKNNPRGSHNMVCITDALTNVREDYHINPKEIGHGHYGTVRKCMNRKTKQWYAIKSIRKSKVSKIQVLKREIDILKKVHHPNIIELVEVHEDKKYLHLITELCTGGELFDRIIAKTNSPEGHFSEEDASRLVHDILDAIRYCHDEIQIVHRDLKPENFLYKTPDQDAPIKIIDFGLSRFDSVQMMKTKVGTPYYVAPEVLRREYTKSCDIWSIGVITYILLCGYPPFYGNNDNAIFDQVKTAKYDFPSPEWDDISGEAKHFIDALLKKDPDARLTAAQAMKHPWIVKHRESEPPQAVLQGKRKSSIGSSVRGANFQRYMAMQKLKKATMAHIATKLTQDEVENLESKFKELDKDGDGMLTVQDLEDALENPTFASLQEELRDLQMEEKVDWRIFLNATMDETLYLKRDKVKMAFDEFKSSDYLSQEDLVNMVGSQQAEEIMSFVDTDGDGRLSFEEFWTAIAESVKEDEL